MNDVINEIKMNSMELFWPLVVDGIDYNKDQLEVGVDM